MTMLTQPTEHTHPTDPLAALEEQQAKLAEVVEDLAAEAAKARTTFEREPTAQAHGLLAVAEQRERNARAALEKYEADTLEPAKIAALKARNERKRAEFAAEFPESAVDDQVARMADAIVNAITQLQGATNALEDLLIRRRSVGADATACGFYVRSHTFDRLVEEANAQIARALPQRADQFVSLAHHSQGNESTLRAEIRLPQRINQSIR